MTKTEYLFGYPKAKYGKFLEYKAMERIADAKALRGKLQDRVRYYPNQQNKFQLWLSTRILKVNEAIATWEKILEIDNN